MIKMAIIQSLLDNDEYIFKMGQFIFHKFPDVDVHYKFKCRNKGTIWTDRHVEEIRKEVNDFCKLKFEEDELWYLEHKGYYHNTYIDFLRLFQPNRNHIYINRTSDGKLQIEITGPLYQVIYFEVPVLAICGEVFYLYNENYNQKEIYSEALKRLYNKTEKLYNNVYTFKLFEFGTRRRFSFDFQDEAINNLKDTSQFMGTSNLYFAKKYNLKSVGTTAHLLYQLGQGLDVKLSSSQKHMLKLWAEYWGGKHTIALTDTINTDYFIQDFDYYLAKLYDGLRHDSGDPFVWGDKMINNYKKLGIDPLTKMLIFSDGLNFDKSQKIYDYFYGKVQLEGKGVGTFITNDTCVPALQNVIKLQRVNGKPVAKISDEPGKTMCEDDEYVKYLLWSYKNKR
jgi:nicotinate phosphoribosyltransferase